MECQKKNEWVISQPRFSIFISILGCVWRRWSLNIGKQEQLGCFAVVCTDLRQQPVKGGRSNVRVVKILIIGETIFSAQVLFHFMQGKNLVAKKSKIDLSNCCLVNDIEQQQVCYYLTVKIQDVFSSSNFSYRSLCRGHKWC